MKRAYTVLEVKSVDEEKREIEGIASTPTPDRVGDIVEPKGARFKIPMPLLWQHNHDMPVGHVTFAKPTRKGIPFKAKIAKIDEPGALKDRVDEAWQSVKSRLVGAVSIGFRAVRDQIERLDDGGLRFKEWEWLELSLVTIPANAEATITSIKSLDREVLAASGRKDLPGDESNTPGASGKSVTTRKESTMDIDKQVAELEERREELVTEMRSFGDVTDLDDEQANEYDEISKELEELDTKLTRAKRMQSAMGAAKAVSTPGSRGEGSRARGRAPSFIATPPKVELAKGIRFARYVIAMAKGRGSVSDAHDFAKRQWSDTPEVARMVKAVAGSSEPGSDAWGSELVEPITREFMELLMPATVIGRIPGFDMMPFNTRIIEQTAGAMVNWVGELAPKPVGEMDFADITLPYHKIAGIVVLSDELVRLSTPRADERVRNQLVRDIALFMDQQFLNPAIGATAARPGAVTNGVTPISASGTDAEAFYADLNAAMAPFDSAEITSDLVLVMPKAVARGVSSLRNALGQKEFVGMNSRGGEVDGDTVIVSNAAPAGQITIIAPGEIAMADDGGVSIDASREATLDMDGGESPSYNLWQRNAVGIRAERWITWLKKREAAVSMITGAAYGPEVSSGE